MGSTASSPAGRKNTFSDETLIREEMEGYAPQFTASSQTELFRQHVPREVVDFTGISESTGLNKFFTKAVTKIVGEDFNCLHLYRNSFKDMKLPVYSTDEHIVFGALGEPGRDLDEKCDSKVSHLMVIKHGTDGPITFNEMLPSNVEEVQDLKDRIATGKKAYENLSKNVPLTECGEKVMEKATKMGIEHSIGIREFLVYLILDISPEFKAEQPGYILKDKDGNEVSEDSTKLHQMVSSVFTDDSLETCVCIQPPDKNTQILTHIHLFKTSGVSEKVNDNYYDCEVILKVKDDMLKEKAAVNSPRADDGALTRTVTGMGNVHVSRALNSPA
tara:strand:+ start:99 stop:1091 length:993 start_codon:yes stop_codon:yes gene_type:complete